MINNIERKKIERDFILPIYKTHTSLLGRHLGD